MIDHLLTTLHGELKQLYKEKFVKLVIFGSYARGQQNKESDIDLLLVLKGPINQNTEIDRLADIVFGQILKYDLPITIIPVSEKEYSLSKISFYRNINIEGIVVE